MKVEIHKIDISSTLPLQFADEGIRAGFPSPAQDYMEQAIDLNKELIRYPGSTFYGRVVGNSMSGEGIDDGDILVIDKSLELIDGDLAVCFINGEFTVKRVKLEKDFAWLVPSNPDYQPIKVTKDDEFTIWGIVTYTVKKNRRKKGSLFCYLLVLILSFWIDWYPLTFNRLFLQFHLYHLHYTDLHKQRDFRLLFPCQKTNAFEDLHRFYSYQTVQSILQIF